jgi:hypothetical protein
VFGIATAAGQPLPRPKGAEVETMGAQSLLNGRPVHVERVTSALPPAELLAHYRQLLGTRSVQTEAQGRTVLSGPLEDRFVSVELRPADDGRTEAWVMARPLRAPAPAPARPPVSALPAGAHWLSTLESVDNGRRVRTSVAAASASLAASREFVARQLSERGYQRVAGAADNSMQMFQRGSDDVMLTVVERNGARMIVLVDSSPQ